MILSTPEAEKLTKSERRFVARKQDKYYPDPTEEQTEWRQFIAMVITMHGAKNLPSDAEVAIAMTLYQERFRSRLTFAECKNAFETNVAGDCWETIKMFGAFTSEFMCSVFNAYIYRRNQVIAKVERVQLPEKSSTPTEAEIVSMKIDILKQLLGDWQDYENDKKVIYHAPLEKWNMLIEFGLAPDFPAKRKQSLWKLAKEAVSDKYKAQKRRGGTPEKLNQSMEAAAILADPERFGGYAKTELARLYMVELFQTREREHFLNEIEKLK